MPIAIYSEQLRCGLLAREEALVPSRVHYPVARVSLLLSGNECFDERVKRLKSEPAQVALMVVVALGIHEEGSVVEHADPAYRIARGHRNPPPRSVPVTYLRHRPRDRYPAFSSISKSIVPSG